MKELVGNCQVCGYEVFCTDGFFNGVVEPEGITCFSCRDRAVLNSLLNQLLEAEKAGVETLAFLLESAPDNTLFQHVKEDEAWSCRGLIESIRREKGQMSTNTGDFTDKVKALPTQKEQLQLLNKGQSWVVRKIDQALKLDMEPETKQFLFEMKQRHTQNIEECERLI